MIVCVPTRLIAMTLLARQGAHVGQDASVDQPLYYNNIAV
jgi:hypothetical protein